MPHERYTPFLAMVMQGSSTSYCTKFHGFLMIHPQLPSNLVETINKLARGRNNVYGDADAHSFDSVVYHMRGPLPGMIRLRPLFGDRRMTRVPSCWCYWYLENSTPGDVTFIRYHQGENFGNYIQWLHFLVDFVALMAEQANCPIAGIKGTMGWQGDAKGDSGSLFVGKSEKPHPTTFFPDDFLPLPKPPDNEFYNGPLSLSPAPPKGKPFESPFHIATWFRFENLEELPQVARVWQLEHAPVEIGGYVLMPMHRFDPKAKRSLFITHGHKDPAAYHSEDPKYPGWVPTTTVAGDNTWTMAATEQERLVKAFADPPIKGKYKQLRRSAKPKRICAGCGHEFTGPADAILIWYYPVSFFGWSIKCLYCDRSCVPAHT